MKCSRLALVLGMVLSGNAMVFGQPPSGPPDMHEPGGGGPSFRHGPPGPPPLIMLATQKSVQTDLKLDRTQKQQIQALEAKLRASMHDRMPPPGAPGQGERPKPPDFEDKATRPTPPDSADEATRPNPSDSADKATRPKRPGEEMEKALAEVLSEKQLARLKQIALQLEGPRALLAPDRVKELQLTEKQQEKIRRLTRNGDKSLHAILDTEQQAKWREMTGRPFRGKITMPGPRMPMPRD